MYCMVCQDVVFSVTIHLTTTTAAQNEVALSYHSVRGLYSLAVVFVTTIVSEIPLKSKFMLRWPSISTGSIISCDD